METELQVGEIVQLKTGSPQMQIARFEIDGANVKCAVCGYWNGKKHEVKTIPVFMLQRCSP